MKCLRTDMVAFCLVLEDGYEPQKEPEDIGSGGPVMLDAEILKE